MSLTPQQNRILHFIRRSIARQGRPPTSEEVAIEFGFRVRSSAYDHLRALQKKGYIELLPGIARGIRLLEQAQDGSDYRLPLVGAIAAGSPVVAPENIETWLAIGAEIFRPAADFLHVVRGNSMNRVVQDGDLVGIRAQADADNGQIIAAALADPISGGELITLKRYSRKGSCIFLKPDSDDDQHRVLKIDLEDQSLSQERAAFRIAGVLCQGFFRGYR